MKEDKSIDTKIDELFRRPSVSVNSKFTKETLSKLKESGGDLSLDSKIEAQWERFPVQASAGFTSSVITSLSVESDEKRKTLKWKRWSLPMSAAAAVALLFVVNPFSSHDINSDAIVAQKGLSHSVSQSDEDFAELYELALGLKGGQALVDQSAYQTLATLVN